MKAAIIWGIAPCIPYMNQRFGGTFSPPYSGLKSSLSRNQQIHSHLLARCFLVRLFFDLENGGTVFLRNVGSYTNDMALHSEDENLYVIVVSAFCTYFALLSDTAIETEYSFQHRCL
jgi:hypothetical protein